MEYHLILGESSMTANENLRNIGIVAHIDAGKTTISENMLYISGEIRSLGSVDKGTAHTDALSVEKERGISVKATSASFIWKDIYINLIDTPGHIDFSAEVERSLLVLDGAILVISAVEGVESQTEIYFKALKAMKIPTIIFINKIDRIGSDIDRVVNQISKLLSKDILKMQCVYGEETQSPSINNILDEIIKESIGYTELIEHLAEKDDLILEKYLNTEKILTDEIESRIISLVNKCKMYPILFGASIKGVGIKELMDAVIKYLPSPKGDLNKQVSGVVFKIEKDKNNDKLAYIRMYNGMIKNKDTVMNITQGTNEKINQIKRIHIPKYEDVGLLKSGEIGCITGLKHIRIGDILGNKDGIPELYHFAVSLLKVQVFPVNAESYSVLLSALEELVDEDPLLNVEWFQEKKEINLNIMGSIQIEILTNILKNRFNLDVTFGKPSVIYKETPIKKGFGFVSYTMPKPCWAVLKFMIEPLERGSGLVYSSIVRDEYILNRYQKQVEKALPQALEQGLYGWEVIDLKITLISGEYHVMHTHAPDFTVATPMGIMNGLASIGTALLEPLLKYRISVPEECSSKVIGDLVNMRGEIDSPFINNAVFTIEGIIPLSSFLEYPIRLGILSGGRGTISTNFFGYRECPIELGATCIRRSVNPLDTAKYILSKRNAF